MYCGSSQTLDSGTAHYFESYYASTTAAWSISVWAFILCIAAACVGPAGASVRRFLHFSLIAFSFIVFVTLVSALSVAGKDDSQLTCTDPVSVACPDTFWGSATSPFVCGVGLVLSIMQFGLLVFVPKQAGICCCCACFSWTFREEAEEGVEALTQGIVEHDYHEYAEGPAGDGVVQGVVTGTGTGTTTNPVMAHAEPVKV